jgi:hypothetical protein
VCKVCGLGLLVEASADAAPEPTQPFLIVDSSLTVQAMPERSERIFNVREDWAVNRHVTDFLLPADDARASALAPAITRAARGEQLRRRVRVRLANRLGEPIWAYVSSCGPPRAALVVLEQG